MQLKMHLKVDPESLFSCIVESVAFDASESTGKTVASSRLKSGFSYTKKLRTKTGKNAQVKVVIDELERPKNYAAHFVSPTGTTAIRYELKPDEGSTQLVYSESIVASSRFESANYKLMSFLYMWKAKRRARSMLRGMEAYILANKDKEE